METLVKKQKGGFYKKDTNGNILVFDLNNKKYRTMKKGDLGFERGDCSRKQCFSTNKYLNKPELKNMENFSGEISI